MADSRLPTRVQQSMVRSYSFVHAAETATGCEWHGRLYDRIWWCGQMRQLHCAASQGESKGEVGKKTCGSQLSTDLYGFISLSSVVLATAPLVVHVRRGGHLAPRPRVA